MPDKLAAARSQSHISPFLPFEVKPDHRRSIGNVVRLKGEVNPRPSPPIINIFMKADRGRAGASQSKASSTVVVSQGRWDAGGVLRRLSWIVFEVVSAEIIVSLIVSPCLSWPGTKWLTCSVIKTITCHILGFFSPPSSSFATTFISIWEITAINTNLLPL